MDAMLQKQQKLNAAHSVAGLPQGDAFQGSHRTFDTVELGGASAKPGGVNRRQIYSNWILSWY